MTGIRLTRRSPVSLTIGLLIAAGAVVGAGSTAAAFPPTIMPPPPAQKSPPKDAKKADALGAPRGPGLKAGYYFDPTDLVAYPALGGYSVVPESDKIDVSQIQTVGLSRQLFVQHTVSQVKLEITIGVSEVTSNPLDVNAFRDRLDLQTDMDPLDHWKDGASNGLSIGDECKVASGSTFGTAENEIAFRRANIFVSILYAYESGPSTVDLTNLASQMDTAILSQPSVTFPQVQSARPTISLFSAGSLFIARGATTSLATIYSDPNDPTPSKTYVELDGDVLTGPERYRAGGKVGSQDLTLIIYDDALLSRHQTLTFNVSP